MHKAGDINHGHGLYRSGCCGIEHTVADNCKFLPCPGHPDSGENPCAGKNATWALVRPTQMINR